MSATNWLTWRSADSAAQRLGLYAAAIGAILAVYAVAVAAVSWITSSIAFLTQYGWGVPVLAAMGIVLVIVVVLSVAAVPAAVAWRKYHPLPSPALGTEATGASPLLASGAAKRETAGGPYITEAFVYSGSAEHGTKPWYSAKLLRNASNARLFIDHSHYAGGVIGFNAWTQRSRILVDGPRTLARDEAVRIEILSPFDQNGQQLWRWGNVPERPADNRYLFIENALHRGRVVFMAEDGTEEYAYFIVLEPARGERPEIPKVVGNWVFSFKREWEVPA
jgi:hypothetical protein